jgi:hypothetical protein
MSPGGFADEIARQSHVDVPPLANGWQQTFLLVLVAISTTASLVCAFKLWRSVDLLWHKLGWTVVLAMPIIGPLLYRTIYVPRRLAATASSTKTVPQSGAVPAARVVRGG